MISRLLHILMGPLTYVVLKTVSSLIADLNVVSNPGFFIFFSHKLSSHHIFGAKNTSVGAIFYWLSTYGFTAEASFNEKALLSRGLGENLLKLYIIP